MNIVELVALYRWKSHDSAIPYFVSDAHVVDLFNNAESESCRRRDLLFDDSTAAVCHIAVTDATSTYALHSKVKKITKAYLEDAEGVKTYLEILSRDELDSKHPGWRDDTSPPYALIVDDQSVRIVPAVDDDYTLKFELYRLPISAMFYPVSPVPVPAPDPLIESPEIDASHHPYLLHWVLHEVYAIPDNDMYDLELSEHHLKKFSRYFGIRTTVDRGRDARRPQRNKVWI